MWFWIGFLFGILAGLFVPQLVGNIDTGWANILSGSVYHVPYVPRPVTFSLISFAAIFALVAGLLKVGK